MADSRNGARVDVDPRPPTPFDKAMAEAVAQCDQTPPARPLSVSELEAVRKGAVKHGRLVELRLLATLDAQRERYDALGGRIAALEQQVGIARPRHLSAVPDTEDDQ